MRARVEGAISPPCCFSLPFKLATAPSPENVTFSRSRRGRDGGSEKGGVGGRQMGKGGREASAGSQKQEDGNIREESEGKEAAAEEGEKGGEGGDGREKIIKHRTN